MRIVALKNWIELAKTLVKGILLGAALLFVVAGTLNTLVRLPTRGQTCVGFAPGTMAQLLLGIGIAFFCGGSRRHSSPALAVHARHAHDDQRGQARASGTGRQSTDPHNASAPPRAGGGRAGAGAKAGDLLHQRPGSGDRASLCAG